MRISIISFVATSLIATAATAGPLSPTTQACLGRIDTFLTCPAGSQRSGTECRAAEPKHGEGAGEHWSGSQRQGPSLFFRDDNDPASTVSFAASYKDHKKEGRVYRFDDQGNLESWSDMAADEDNGLSVTCLPNGRVWYMASYKRGQLVGISRAWRASDGSFSYAFEHDGSGTSRSLSRTPALEKRPDHLCRPAKCDVTAKPDLSNGLGN